MAERNLPAALKTSLLNNDEYSYFHLVKFEKPRSTSVSGIVSGKATDYAYITDASHNITFDDGSLDAEDIYNGDQVYVANKLISVGTVSETTEARASNISITLSGTALGTIQLANVTFTTTSMTADIDLLDAGFQEGDVLLLEKGGAVNDNKYVRINKFTNNNQTVSLTPINTTITADATSRSYTLSYASEEVNALILSKESTNYSNYMNREVFIYRAHSDPETGDIVGEPFLIFRGIVQKGSVSDNMMQSSKVVWSLTSHWGDFVRVQGRMSSDSAHRALSTTGEPDLASLVRPEYAQDLGFSHAEKAINIMAIYQAMETRYKMKKRGGLAGLLGGKKLVEYEVEVDREVDLQFNLSAKYLPIVYGIQKVDSFPVFADTLNSDSSTIYVAHAICEGEIGGIYDIHIDDASTVCVDEADYDVRAGGGDTIEVVCNGRADRGDVLVGSKYNTGGVSTFWPVYDEDYSAYYSNWGLNLAAYFTSLGIGNNSTGGEGIQHEHTYTFNSPIDTDLIIHTGKPDQRANDELVNVASQGNFKIQQDYYSGSTANYWTTAHRLLDTAYVVGKYKVSEGEVTIPKLEFVVRGKILDCYNYDYSYTPDASKVSADESNFVLGENVGLYNTATDDLIGVVTIIDKWSFYNENAELEYRFRFSSNPQESGTRVTAFYMKDGSANKWHMVSYDHSEVNKSVVGTIPTATISSASASTGTLTLVLSSPSSEFTSSVVAGQQIKINFSETETTSGYEVVSLVGSTLTLTDSGYGTNTILNNINNNGFTGTVVPLNLIKLNSSDAKATDYYKNREIVLYRFDSEGAITSEVSKKISSYNATTNIATLDFSLPVAFTPDVSQDKYSIKSTGDKRVSTNPAIQLMDYLKSVRYGKGLKDSDLNLPTFLEAARSCDTRSDVTVQMPSATSIFVGDVYRYAPSGRLVFEGTVKSIDTVSVYVSGTLTSFKQVTFTDVIGKLAYKWNNWRNYTAGDYVWHNGNLYLLASDGPMPGAPTHTGLTSASLTKSSGSGSATVSMSITDGYTSSGNPLIKKYTNAVEGFNSPGYSLYDSDDVKYWVYVGWDEPEQRFVTRHQMNQVINTSSPLFDNINSMLTQFNGIMRYANGKYELAIKTAAPTSFESYKSIAEGDIIGELKVQDKGQKDVYNSMAASIIDPQNKFAARSISFFNSEYLKEDKGIRRQGNFAMPGISNYYNARINIKQYLDESRFGLDVSFQIDSKGYLLLTGEIIQLSYSRFGWENKLFRIDNLNFQANGLVQVTATEHNDTAFLIGNLKGSTSIPLGEGSNNPTAIAPPAAPTGLTATNDAKGGITLSWTNSATFNTATHTTEILASTTNDRSLATLIDTTQAESLVDIIVEQELVTKYYWVRHTVIGANGRSIPSEYYPVGATAGVSGSATGAIDGSNGTSAVSVKLTSADYSIAYDATGANPDPSGTVTVTAVAQNVENGFFKFTVDGVGETTFTDGSGPLSDTYSVTIPASYFSSPKTVRVGVAEGDQTELAFDTISLFAIKPGTNGDDGVDALTVILSNEAHTLPTTNTGVVTYTGSGTTIELYEGATALTYDGVGTTNGTWKITAVGTNITVGTLTDSGTYVTVNDHSAMNATNAKITYTITGKRTDGTAISLTKVQSFGKSIQGIDGSVGVNARAVTLNAGDLAFAYDSTGANPGPATTTVTATALNTVETVYYQFVKNGTSVQNTTTNTYTYTPQSSFANMPDTLEVRIREGSNNSTVLATDSLAFLGLRDAVDGIDGDPGSPGADGTDALTFVVSNESHTLPTTNTGTVTYTGSGTAIYVYEGTTALTYDGVGTSNSTWKITASGTNITVGTFTDSGSYVTVADHSAMTDTNASITYTITGKRANGTVFTVTKQQSFAKSVEGDDGSSGVNARAVSLDAGTLGFAYNTTGTVPSPTNTTVTATALNTVGTVYYQFVKNGTSVQNTTTNTYTYTPQANFVDMPDTLEVRVREGSNSSTILARDTIAFLGLRAVVDGVDGDPGAPGSDGLDALTIILSNEAHTLPTTNTGTVTYTGSGTTIRLYEGTTELPYVPGTTANGQWKVTAVGTDVTPGTLTDSGSYLTVGNHSAMTANTAVVTYTITGKRANGTGISLVKVQSLSKSIEGDDGAPGLPGDPGDPGATGPRTATGYVYYQLSSATEPSAPTATSYSFSTGAFSGLTTNWDEPAPTFAAGNANKYWYAPYTVAEATFGGTQTITFGTVRQGIGFSGLVTFSGTNLTDGSSTYNPATVVNANTTTIDGGKITTDTITANQIAANAVTASELQISSSSSTASSMFFDGANNRIDIKDSTGTLRVRIGNLT